MTELRSGQILRNFQTKSGKTASLRVLKIWDTKKLLGYVNKLSSEDTFVAYSGEKQTFIGEVKFVRKTLKNLKKNNAIPIICEVNGTIAAICRASRNSNMKKRSRHIATIVISVRKEFRGEGIGKECIMEIINQSKRLKDIKILKLTAFANNDPAINLYTKTGFKIVARLPKQYLYRGEYIASVVMQYELYA